MSRDFTTVQPANFVGSLSSRPITYDKALGKLARTVPVELDWAAYGAGTQKQECSVTFNLLGQTVANPLDALRSVYIDNTFSDVPIYVYINETRYVVTCPPGDIIWAPVFASDDQTIIVYGKGFFTGRVPRTVLHFSNVEAPALYIPTEFNTISAVTADFVHYNSTVAVQSSLLFSSPIGIADPSRIAAVFVTSGRADNAPLSLTSATINGTVAQIAKQETMLIVSGERLMQALVWAPVPTGTAASVNLQFDNDGEGFAYSTYIIKGWTQAAPYSVGSYVAPSKGTSPIVFNTLSGGTAIVGAVSRTATPNLLSTWYGEPVIDSTWMIPTGSLVPTAQGSYAHKNFERSGLGGISTETNLAVGALWI